MIDYRVIDKAEIPQPPQARSGNFGDWVAMMRLLALLPPHQAIEIQVGELHAPSMASAMYSAAKGAGIRISIQGNGSALYVVRTGQQPTDRKLHKKTICCEFCKRRVPQIHKLQKTCKAEECQKKRRKQNNDRNHELRRKK